MICDAHLDQSTTFQAPSPSLPVGSLRSTPGLSCYPLKTPDKTQGPMPQILRDLHGSFPDLFQDCSNFTFSAEGPLITQNHNSPPNPTLLTLLWFTVHTTHITIQNTACFICSVSVQDAIQDRPPTGSPAYTLAPDIRQVFSTFLLLPV